VYQYYDLDVGKLDLDKGVVCFYMPTKSRSKDKNQPMWESDRVLISCQIPDKTKAHFFPKEYWLKLEDKKIKDTDFYPLEALSGVFNGMITAGYPYTKSPYYTAPYLLIFRTQQHGIEPNYVSFNDFLLSPSYNHILALLNYDETLEKFVPSYHADVLLPYQNVLSLNSVLEFHITDANRKPVEFKDLSQLFISIQFL
jgi:hypothetical protein